jgi:hypothetical protein
VPSGWSVDTKNSDQTHLVLDGPQGLLIALFTQQDPSSATLTQVFQQALATAQQTFPDANVCNQPKSASVPGTPSVNGAFEAICFTVTPQNGSATPYASLVYAGLVQANGFQLQVETDFFLPQSMPNNTFNQLIGPVVPSVQWLQISASGSGGSGGSGNSGNSGSAGNT